jgi:hypothetical protein
LSNGRGYNVTDGYPTNVQRTDELLLVEPLNTSKRQAIQAPLVKHGLDNIAPVPEQEVRRQVATGIARYAASRALRRAHGAKGADKCYDFANAGYGSHSHL